MIQIDDTQLLTFSKEIEIINQIGRREITHVIHDIDGTHSIIRNWPPVMSFILHWAMTYGLPDGFDSDENIDDLVEMVGVEKFPETDRFCIETAGMSALTQMEFAVRRAFEMGNTASSINEGITEKDQKINSAIIADIWKGLENFDYGPEKIKILEFISDRTPKLFIFYEKILNRYCRDSNMVQARKNPAPWRVPGSLDFITYLKDIGCLNYFVTGSVVYENGGILEEVTTLEFPIGDGELIEEIHGSSWNRKIPKEKVFKELLERLEIEPEKVLVIGDGRSEIQAGVDMGCVVMSRLPGSAVRQRELHTELGTNYIVEDFTSNELKKLIKADKRRI